MQSRFQKLLSIKPFVFRKIFFLWAFLGVISGLIAGIYWLVLDFIIDHVSVFDNWLVVPIMTFSGLMAGLIIHFIGDPGEIHLIVNNIRFNKGKLDPKQNPSMILSSLFCVAAGGSLGPEAPLVQVTGSTGSWLGKKFNLTGENLRSMSIAGMASGFTALFGAPLGGSLFALEILHHRHAVEYYRAIIPALVSSSFSYIIFAIIIQLGLGATWIIDTYQYQGVSDFINVVLFALVATLFGWIFIHTVNFFKYLFQKIHVPIYIKTTIGGVLLGAIAFYFPLTRYFGHYEINTLLASDFTLWGLIALLVFKILAIAITVTSGWRGGFIIPLFFAGATLGLILHAVFPQIDLSLAIISCMAAINACVTRTPMSTTILLATLTGFSYLIPILFASLTGYFFAPRLPFIGSQLKKAD
ncbi:MAG: chloride channel protein [Flavobacteriaceae bacterium]|nr:chloride channel protein [Psychroflexus sp.]